MPSSPPSEKLPRLSGFCETLLSLAQVTFKNRIKCSEEDDFGVMAITFTAKQSEHMLSVLKLVEAKRYADASVLARVMLEGMGLLIWAARAPESRPRDWRAYSLVFDLKTLRNKQAAGEAVEAGFETELLERLATDGAKFLKKGADPANPSSYKPRWHLDDSNRSIPVSGILSELRNAVILDLYGDLSDWIHWNAKGIGAGLKRDGDIVHVDWSAEHWGLLALAAGFQSLFQSLELLNDHLELGHRSSLESLQQRYLAAFGSGRAA